jgi:hypothetical protein
MATTTPNFGWPVPTSTDLVKNGATAIEALGDAIDASLVDLEGGTTGQVLAKASNTDMDFAWVAQDDSNAIQNSIVDAKGDLISATANDTPARLAVGANGETLVADSSTSTGLRYQAPKTQNAWYNSGFDIAQRGTNFTGLSAVDYTLDRWAFWSTTGGQSNYASQQSVGNLSVTPNQALRYCGRFGRTAGTTNTGARIAFQTLETNDSVRFAGQTVTMSFYARAGANYSATSNGLQVYLTSGTGTDQIMYAFTGSASVATSTVTLTTSWQRFSITGAVGTNVTQLANLFIFTPTGTAGAADYFEITGVQLEVGSVATPFNRMSGTIQGELAACQRYYENNYPIGYAPGSDLSGFNFGNVTAFVMGIEACLPVGGTVGSSRSRGTVALTQKRILPTVRLWDTVGNLNKYTATDVNGSFISNNNAFDTFGGATGLYKLINFQTVAASATHIWLGTMWEASAEL